MESADNTSGPALQRKERCTLQCALSLEEEKSSSLRPFSSTSFMVFHACSVIKWINLLITSVQDPHPTFGMLFQPMFDEYFDTPPVSQPVPPALAVHDPVSQPAPPALADHVLVFPIGTPASFSIEEDAPSISISSSSVQQSPFVHQGVALDHTLAVNPFAPMDDVPFVNIFASDPSSEATSSGEVSPADPNQSILPHEHLRKWTNSHPIDNIIGNPSRPVSTSQQLATDTLWCIYNSILLKEARSSCLPFRNSLRQGGSFVTWKALLVEENPDGSNCWTETCQFTTPCSHFIFLIKDIMIAERPTTQLPNSNIIPYSQYLLETQNAVVRDTNSSAQQDAMILYVFEQLSHQVTNCNKVNKDNLIANETLSAELERFKERVKFLEERQNMNLDFEKEINSLKQTLSEKLKENESLTKTFNVFQNESKEKEAKNIDNEIALEKKVKELDNIKAQQISLMLYDDSVISKETNVISIADSEETLMPEDITTHNFLLCNYPSIKLDAIFLIVISIY
ncbi:hypothetical protein Tco_1034336 [Tanacetum coccineum]